MADYDIASAFNIYQSNTLGIHGGSINGVPAAQATQQRLLNFQLGQLGIAQSSPLGQRLAQAHFQLADSNGFLRYRDPAVVGDQATIFCPTGAWQTGNLTGCTNYSGVTMYSDGIVTTPGTVTVDDILRVNSTVQGDLNPNFTTGLLWRSPYGVVAVGDGGVWNIDAPSRSFITWIADGGVVNMLPGGRLGPGGEVLIDIGATINLQGGALGSMTVWNNFTNASIQGTNFSVLDYQRTAQPITSARRGSVITGTGTLLSDTQIAGILAPVGGSITIRPTAGPDDYFDSLDSTNLSILGIFNRFVRLTGTSVTLLQVSPDTNVAPILNVSAQTHFRSVTTSGTGANARASTYSERAIMHVPMTILPGATLSVNFARGFYRPGQSIPLLDSYRETTELGLPSYYNGNCTRCLNYGPDSTPTDLVGSFTGLIFHPYFSGHYTNFIRGTDGAEIALDINALSQFITANEDSLLGFDLVYTPQQDSAGFVGVPLLGIPSIASYANNFSRLELIARPAFEDTSIFANAASGDGLGVAIRAASYRDGPGNANLLGALQFSSRSAARGAAGVLRGDGYATQMLLDQALVGSLDDLQMARLADRRAVSRGATSMGRAAFSGDALAATVNGLGGITQIDGLNGLADNAGGKALAYLVDGPAAAAVEATDDVDAAPAPVAASLNSWGQLMVGQSAIRAGDGVDRLTGEYQGLTLGFDRDIGAVGAIVGGSFTYLSIDGKTPDASYRSDSELVSGSLYANIPYRGIGDVSISARVTNIDREVTRTLYDRIGGLEVPVSGQDSSLDLSARLENTIAVGGAKTPLRVIAPIIAYQRTSAPSVTETGGDFALEVGGDNLTSLRYGAGIELSQAFRSDRMTVTPQIRVTYERETEDLLASAEAGFVGEADLSFTVNSRELGRDIGKLDVGLTLAQANDFALGVHYAGQVRNGQQRHTGYVGITKRF